MAQMSTHPVKVQSPVARNINSAQYKAARHAELAWHTDFWDAHWTGSHCVVSVSVPGMSDVCVLGGRAVVVVIPIQATV